MNLQSLIIKVCTFLCVCVAAACQAQSFSQEHPRFRALAEELRCLVCQNQSIADSTSDLANDLKREVLRLMNAGQSDAEIKAFLVNRYSDFVLFRPPLQANTLVLWLAPFALLALGAGVAIFVVKRRKAPLGVPSEAPPSQAVLDALLAPPRAASEPKR